MWDFWDHIEPYACVHAMLLPSWSLYEVLSSLSFSFNFGSCRPHHTFFSPISCLVLLWIGNLQISSGLFVFFNQHSAFQPPNAAFRGTLSPWLLSCTPSQPHWSIQCVMAVNCSVLLLFLLKNFYLCFHLSRPNCVECGILVPQSGTEPVLPGKTWSLNHCITREVRAVYF